MKMTALLGTQYYGLEGDHLCMAKPLHVQKIEQALCLDPLISYVTNLLKQTQSDLESSTDTETDVELEKNSEIESDDNYKYANLFSSKVERRADKARLYNFSKVKKSRKWLKNILLSDSSSESEDDINPKERLKDMLRMHKYQKKCQKEFYGNKELQKHQYYSVGLLSSHDKYLEHNKSVIGTKKKLNKDKLKLDKKKKVKLKKPKEKVTEVEEDTNDAPSATKDFEEIKFLNEFQPQANKLVKNKKMTPEQAAVKRRKILMNIAKKEIPKAQKQKASGRKDMLSQMKKLAKDASKECRKTALQSQKQGRDVVLKARRLSKEMMAYWKRFEKVEKEHRKKAEKEAHEQRKMDFEIQEMKRQQRKLNFLITQTELYAHFMAKKLGSSNATEARQREILHQLDEEESAEERLNAANIQNIHSDDYDSEVMKSIALKNVENALKILTAKAQCFDAKKQSAQESVLSNPAISTAIERQQPSLFEGQLKGYQLKGMNWLANLYDQGINGILADEMGLGKTVQTIALLGHLAENLNIWGPFLIVAPASTLHNWQQEVTRFISRFKVVPYWGNTQDRKVLRKFWNHQNINSERASFHVVITSYQLVIQDVKYFQRIPWNYMVLDEAQALKSTSSARWKTLLGFNCRNRLLLSGTPIQNSMAELWALLHFIMPTLFDSHDEFNEWFSKDIESHVEKQSGIDEEQLSRLHMILKPFMLRRVKRDVENELSDKIEILMYCPLTTRQKMLYRGIRNKISIEDLLQVNSSANAPSTAASNSTNSLMNLVMQFRKVCNHPELFERREIRAPLFIFMEPYTIPKLVFRDGILSNLLLQKTHILHDKLSIHHPSYIHQSLQDDSQNFNVKSTRKFFSFTRFMDISPSEMSSCMQNELISRWWLLFISMKHFYTIHHRHTWKIDKSPHMRVLDKDSFILHPHLITSVPSIHHSHHLSQLIFTSFSSCMYAHLKHIHHSMPETLIHLKIRVRNQPLSSPSIKPPDEGSLDESTLKSFIHSHTPQPSKIYSNVLTEFPRFLYNIQSKVNLKCGEWYCSDRSAAWKNFSDKFCGSVETFDTVMYGHPDLKLRFDESKSEFTYEESGGLIGIQPRHGYSHVYIPNKDILISDAGKLWVLDTLLARLKKDGHRVLIYSQMTRMIDILEEYMWHRKHIYMKLDGSSKISDRRDMVADFQSNSDIFVFLLSTRAGGLGINLTAADTVIFYDSDWNPTVDQQAMDRAHRLGQTKQVTVYRLICKGTIEERILQRAKEKSEIQRMVISGGQFRPDVLKPKEVVSLLLDDDDMEKKLRDKAHDKKAKEEYNKEERKRKREKIAAEKGLALRGPGRPKKKKCEEEINITIPAHVSPEDSLQSYDSIVASPESTKSLGSIGVNDESSNDGLLIVDDNMSGTVSPITVPSPISASKRGNRPRGRPRGTSSGRRPAGRGSVRKAIAAAEIAGAEAGKYAAYAAYGYQYTGGGFSSSGNTPDKSPGQASKGFYTARKPSS